MPVPSLRLPLGTRIPWFSVTDLDGKVWDTASLPVGRPVLVMFLCEHSPYVAHIENHLAAAVGSVVADYTITSLAICSNDAVSYPSDAPAGMREQARRASFPFPYCVDTDQRAAAAFGASCTPEFFLYDASWLLAYHGQYDDSRPAASSSDSPQVSGHSLLAAIDAVANRRYVDPEQSPSFGCSIKWRSGNEPDYLFALAD